ncbi:hypothetical protein ACLB2K_055163 [Fragaria x ananassa]
MARHGGRHKGYRGSNVYGGIGLPAALVVKRRWGCSGLFGLGGAGQVGPSIMLAWWAWAWGGVGPFLGLSLKSVLYDCQYEGGSSLHVVWWYLDKVLKKGN